jgi:two-component system, NarL family, response regulator NreC
VEDDRPEITVAIAEDQAIYREGLVNLVNSFDNIRVLFSEENGRLLFDKLKNESPDLVLLDFRMPELGGIPTTQLIREHYPNIRVLILSMYADHEFVESAIANGANGYLSKDDHPSEIEKAILSTMEMGYYMNDRTSKMLLTKMMNAGSLNPVFRTNNIHFSQLEMQVIQLICEEYTTQEIADQLNRSRRTIEGLRTEIMQKIGCRNVVGVVLYAVKNKLFVS